MCGGGEGVIVGRDMWPKYAAELPESMIRRFIVQGSCCEEGYLYLSGCMRAAWKQLHHHSTVL
jgi:hypothetical protein